MKTVEQLSERDAKMLKNLVIHSELIATRQECVEDRKRIIKSLQKQLGYVRSN